jgi:putative tricarboxylic transport membrane protein
VKRLDLASSLFWLLASIAIFRESLRLGVGTLHNPGMGFMALGASGILGLLAVAVFVRAALQKQPTQSGPLFRGGMWPRVLMVLAALTAYAALMPRLGYLITTFALMTVLFFILEKKRPLRVVVSALASTLVTYFVFSKWLNCQFPDGLFGL